MAEYINREKTKRELSEWCISLNSPHLLSRDDTMFLLDNIPAADVAPVVHGQWVTHYRSGTTVAEGYVSTCCDMWNNRKSDYCPNCGARMDGDSDG